MTRGGAPKRIAWSAHPLAQNGRVSLTRAWLLSLTLLWLVTGLAALAAATVLPVAHLARALLALRLRAATNQVPSAGHAIALTAHNVQVSGWPLLLPVLGAHRHDRARSLADAGVALSIALNGTLVGLAIGAYGARLFPYIPQLGLEWGGVALGGAGWMLARRGGSSVRTILVVAGLLIAALGTAAIVETVAVPHR